MQLSSAVDKPLAAVSNSAGSKAASGKTPASLTLCVLFAVFCNCAGWLLSWLHQLNFMGYAVLFSLGVTGLVVFRRALFPSSKGASPSARFTRRFRRVFPCSFLVLSAMAFAGGALYPPNNYDGLAYRTPRVLHWLAQGNWHWIHTDFARLNVRGCGFEWLCAPWVALFRTDRFLFLINVICFLLLPGRMFAILSRLGVRPRSAWHWMWILPTGYCFLLQAGSIGNDLVGAFFAMAAFELALRVRQSGNVSQLWLSILAAGLMTSSKTFNILMLPAWFIAIFPSLRLLPGHWAGSTLAALIAAAASFLPTAILNRQFCGDWTGQAAEQVAAMGSGAPVFHVVVNALLLLMHNFVPTFFPWANQWNELMTRLIPPPLANKLSRHFEPAGARFQLGEMQIEEMAGLGFGVSLLILATLLYCLFVRRRSLGSVIAGRLFCSESWICLGAWAGAGVLMATSGLNCPGRYLAPFYIVLLAPFLAAASLLDCEVMRSKWWRAMACAGFLLAGLLLIFTQARPLFPAQTVLKTLAGQHPGSGSLKRAQTVYSVYAGRGDAFKPARALLPASANPLGLVTSDDPETSLWRPFGSRRILHICKDDTPEFIRSEGIKYALINSNVLHTSVDEWLARNEAAQLHSLKLQLRAGKEPSQWYLVEFAPREIPKR